MKREEESRRRAADAGSSTTKSSRSETENESESVVKPENDSESHVCVDDDNTVDANDFPQTDNQSPDMNLVDGDSEKEDEELPGGLLNSSSEITENVIKFPISHIVSSETKTSV